MFGDGVESLVATIADGHFQAVALEDFFEPEKYVRVIFDD